MGLDEKGRFAVERVHPSLGMNTKTGLDAPGVTKSVAESGLINIMIAEDDPHDQMLFLMAAEECAAKPSFSFMDDGEAVLSELRRLTAAGTLPDMLVLDMRMPKLDGHEVLNALTDEPQIKPAVVGVFSSSHRQQDIDSSIAKGAAWHRVKPSRFDELVAFVEDIVTQCEQGRL